LFKRFNLSAHKAASTVESRVLEDCYGNRFSWYTAVKANCNPRSQQGVPYVDTTELTPDSNGSPDSGPRTPWSLEHAIRERVARPLVDLDEPDEL